MDSQFNDLETLFLKFPEGNNIRHELENQYVGHSFALHQNAPINAQCVDTADYQDPTVLLGTEPNLKDLILRNSVCLINDCQQKFNIDNTLSLSHIKKYFIDNPNVTVLTCALREREWHADSKGNLAWAIKYATIKMKMFKFLDLALATSGKPTYGGWNDARVPFTNYKTQTLKRLGPRRIRQPKQTADRKKLQKVYFITHLDLLQNTRRDIYAEMQKLPEPLALGHDQDLLSTYPVLPGVNKIQLFLKSAGSRTGAHCENSNILSVNYNAGPGACEWYCVPWRYVQRVRDLLQTKAPYIIFSSHNYWPHLADVVAAGIPICRFIQPPFATVIIGVGTLHWVQALSSTVNIAWNIAPNSIVQLNGILEMIPMIRRDSYQGIFRIKSHMFKLALERATGVADDKFLRGLAYAMLVLLIQAHVCYKKLIENGWVPVTGVELSEFVKCRDGRADFWCRKCRTEVFLLHGYFLETKREYTESDVEYSMENRPPLQPQLVARLLCSDCLLADTATKITHKICLVSWVTSYDILKTFMGNYEDRIFPRSISRSNPNSESSASQAQLVSQEPLTSNISLPATSSRENATTMVSRYEADNRSDNNQNDTASESSSRVHNSWKQRQKTRKQPYACDKCAFKTDGLKSFDKHYANMHTDARNIYCPDCNYVTKHWNYFMLHQEKHGKVALYPKARPIKTDFRAKVSRV